ncbi:MAG: 5-(carboxyamino)imidazole ribonucleotide mutase [Syntrophales bacterium]|nr:5-(carboxyamino)imidazole ribonucleotide mutase [Syntrophales bacterium]
MSLQSKPVVSIVMGSENDLPIMREAAEVLKKFGVSYEYFLTSAHRSPERTWKFAKSAEERGIKIIIAGAGAAAHLPGVIASLTTLPVIGVPIDSTALGGLDALLSIAQMPGGVPVATMAIGKAGARNAALFAIRILSLTDDDLKGKLQNYFKELAENVEQKQKSLSI